MNTLTNQLAEISKLADDYINQNTHGRFFGDKSAVMDQLLTLKKIQAQSEILTKLIEIEHLIKQANQA